MTAFLISVDDLNVSFSYPFSGTQAILMSGVTISNTSTFVMKLSGVSGGFVSDGTILALFNGAGLQMTNSFEYMTFGSSSIYRSDAAVGSPSILSSGGQSSVTNHGLISATQAVALAMTNGGNAIYNDGTIEGGSGGLFLGINGGVGDRLVNDGTILAGNAQLPAFDARFNHAVQIEGDGSSLINHGTLSAIAAFGAGVNIGSISFTGAGSRVENYGAITSALWWGVDMATLVNGGATLFNHGLITGGTGGVRGGIFADAVTNSGTVQGRIDLGAGNDLYDGRGGMVFGQITGGLGNDTMIGGAQDDSLFGDLGNEVMRGGFGDDAINGSNGLDTISGGAGDDTITGGFNRDVITGGAGADTFVFVNSAEIGNSVATSDVIRDFTSTVDVLDFALLPGTLIYIGSAVFSNVVGQLRFTSATGLLQGDTNGDSVADFTLALAPGTVLAVGDLVL